MVSINTQYVHDTKDKMEKDKIENIKIKNELLKMAKKPQKKNQKKTRAASIMNLNYYV